MFLSLRLMPKLTLALVLFAAVLVLSIGLSAAYNARAALESATVDTLLATAIEKEATFDAWLKDRQKDIELQSTSADLIRDLSAFINASDTTSAQATRERIAAQLRTGESAEFLALFVMEADSGRVVAASRADEEGLVAGDQTYFRSGQAGLFVQPPYYSGQLKRATMTIAAPLRDSAGRLLGVLAGHLDLNELNAIVALRDSLRQTDDVYLVNAVSQFVTPPRFMSEPAVLERTIQNEAVRLCLQQSSGVVTVPNYRGVPSITVYRWLTAPQLCLIATIDQPEAFAPARTFAQNLLRTGSLILLGAVVLAALLARMLTRPIRVLQVSALRLGQGDLAARVPETSQDELGLLARAFNQMAGSLAEKDAQVRAYAVGLEQKVQEQTAVLRASEAELRALFAAMTDVIFVFDSAGHYVRVAPTSPSFLYKPADDLIGRALHDIFPRELADFFLSQIRYTLEQRQTVSFEYHLPINGMDTWFATTLAPMSDETVLWVARDVTDRTLAEEKRRQSDELYRTLINASPDGITVTDTQGRVVFTSAQARTIFGYGPSDEILGLSILDWVDPVDRARVTASFQRVMTGESVARRNNEFVLIRKDGTRFAGEVNAAPLHEANGTVQGMVAITRDITERKQAEAALAMHQQRLEEQVAERTAALTQAKEQVEAILNSSSDGIVLVDVDRGIQQCNAAFYALFAAAADDTLQAPLISLVSADDAARLQEVIQAVVTTRISHQLEVHALRRDDAPFEAEVGIAPVHTGGATLHQVVCTWRDITQRKQAEAALNTKVAEERAFQGYLKALHDITLELMQVDELDAFYERVVALGRERLDLNRFAVFLYDPADGVAQGTYGTDTQGRICAEPHIRFAPNPTGIMYRAFNRVERFCVDENAPLYDNRTAIAVGWNAATVLWNGTQSLGWLVADNLLTKTPASKPLLDIFSLYGLTVGALLTQKRTALALRESEMRLRETQQMLRTVLDTIPVRVFWKDRDSVYLGCNRLFAEGAGLQHPANIVGKRDSDLPWATAEAAAYRADDLTVMERETPRLDYEETHTTASGKSLFLQTSKLPLRDAANNVMGILGVSVDITHRKAIENTLRQYAGEVEDLYNNAPCGYHSLDADGVFVRVNDTELDWLGYTRQDVIGTLSFADLLTAESQKTFQHVFPLFKTQGWIKDLEYDLVRKDGSILPVLLSSVAVYDEQRRYIMSRTTFIDITALKQTQNALRENEERLRILFENVPDALYLATPDHTFLDVNPAALKMTGLPREQIIGRSIFELNLLPPEESARLQTSADTRNNDAKAANEIAFERTDGTIVTAEVLAHPITIQGQRMQLGIVHDVSLRKQAEDELRRALAHERELNELKTRFVSLVSHEFRTPLASIHLASDLLRRYFARMSDAQRQERLTTIQTEVQQLVRLLDEVLTLSRIERGKLAFNPQPLDIRAFCESLIEPLQAAHDAYQFVCSIETDCARPSLDGELVQHILSNLLNNAVKYSPAGSRVYLDLSSRADQVVFKVRDEGIGIPPEDQLHIFEAFHRANNVGRIQGTGLGLSIVKQMAERHGGTVSFTSTPRDGTTFTVMLPNASVNGDCQ